MADLTRETIYDARPELRHPLRFLREAVHDLQRSPVAAWRLFRSNVQARHRRTWLGYAWLVAPTLATTVLWWYVNSRRIIDVAPTGIPYAAYVMTGTVLWHVFVEALNAPLQQLNAGRQMITRSRVPHEVLVIAGVLEVLLNAAVRLAILVPVLLAFGVRFTLPSLLTPVGVLALLLLGLAVGMFAATAGLLYDDVGRALTLLTGFLFFLTPIVYRAPSSGILRLNPLTPLIDTTRAWLTSAPSSTGFAVVVALTIPTLTIAWLLHRLAKPHVVARMG